MSKKIYYVEVKEAFVAVQAEDEEDAEARVNEMINDGEVDPVQIVNRNAEMSDYSREILSVEEVISVCDGDDIYE